MTKNIILCSDGTGNRGGETPDTNVYRMYETVERHTPERGRSQITYYDNGVGTSTNKYVKAITGAIGLGFALNVRQLYEYLALNYDEGDIIYLFGFSRGAATVRAFGGMLQECGLVNRNHAICQKDGKFDYKAFQQRTRSAFDHYRDGKGGEFKAQDHVIPSVRIKFMGVWDTVSALGFPYHRIGDPLIEDLVERPLPVWFARACDRLFNFGSLAHTFYNYTPNEIVDHVYHAIAIDDERKSFLPRVWDETGHKGGGVTQVWFSGVHSDVGGSYNQTGLAYVTLAWMMERAEHHGLDFQQGAMQHARDKANEHGKLHNSRDGFALYYRYAPRDFEVLCADNSTAGNSILKGSIKIHKSVLDRMSRSTDTYSPGLLPREFEIVDTPVDAKNVDKLVEYGVSSPNPVDPHVSDEGSVEIRSGSEHDWSEDRQSTRSSVRWRRRLYRIFADFTLFVFVYAFWLWCRSDEEIAAMNFNIPDFFQGLFGMSWSSVFDGSILRYLTPTMFDNFIQVAWVQNPIILLLILLTFIALRQIRVFFMNDTIRSSRATRDKIKAVLQAVTENR